MSEITNLCSLPNIVRLEVRPDPFSTVPFPHDPDFVRRDALLDQVHEKVSIPDSRIALVALGGVGSGNTGPLAARSKLTIQ